MTRDEAESIVAARAVGANYPEYKLHTALLILAGEYEDSDDESAPLPETEVKK